jgi:hypothetical protein
VETWHKECVYLITYPPLLLALILAPLTPFSHFFDPLFLSENKEGNHKDLGPPSRSLTPVPIPSRSTTPMPTQIAHQPSFRSGTLTIRIFSGKYFKLLSPPYPSVCTSEVSVHRRRLLTSLPFFRSWPRSLPGCPHPGCHPESPRCRSTSPHIILKSREHATTALLVAPLYRP